MICPSVQENPHPKVVNCDTTLQGIASFQLIGLNPLYCRCLQSIGFTSPTPIQYHSIKSELENPHSNLIAQSKSGTGKTLCYITIVFLHLLQKQKLGAKCYSLIILPTRELSLQVFQCFKRIQSTIQNIKCFDQQEKTFKQRLKSINLMLSIGGIPFEDDKRNYATNGGHIIVGTIGRIIELTEKQVIRTEDVELLVLDEGDKLFQNKNKRFTDLIDKIWNKSKENQFEMERKSRLIIFSATYSEKLIKELSSKGDFTYIQTLADRHNKLIVSHTRNFLEFLSIDQEIASQSIVGDSLINLSNIKKFKIPVKSNNTSLFNAKMHQLISLLNRLEYTRCLIFVEKKILLGQIQQKLIEKQIQFLLIHGSLTQSARIKLMNQANTSKIIISSDLLARGIDLRLDLVILFDAKKNDTFWHRIGRTGRYGRTGVVISLDEVEDWQEFNFEKVQNYLNQIRDDKIDKKQYYGEFLTELGGWHDIDQEKEQIQRQKYQYFDQKPRLIQEQKQQNHIIEKTHQNHKLYLKNSYESEQQFKMFISKIMNCEKCQTLMANIQNLTKYSFKIRQFI